MNEENKNPNVVDNPEPNWSLPMFWEDLTFILKRIFDFIKSLFWYGDINSGSLKKDYRFIFLFAQEW